MPLFTRIMAIVVGERFRMVVRATKITCGGMGHPTRPAGWERERLRETFLNTIELWFP